MRLPIIHALEQPITSLSEEIVRTGGAAADAQSKVLAATTFEERDFEYNPARAIALSLLSFFHDRLKVYLRDAGARYDLIDAVLASGRGAGDGAISPLEGEMGGNPEGGRKPSSHVPPSALPGISPPRGEISQNDDLLLIIRRVEALAELLDTEDGKNLLAGTKRAVNILAAEEKKGTEIAAHVDQELFIETEEKILFSAVNNAEKEAAEAIEAEDFPAAMRAMSRLRAPVDTFFDHVLVNDEDDMIRANRLALLARIRAVTGQVADFSKVAG